MRTKAGFGIAVLGVIVLVSAIVSLIVSLTHSRVEASVTSQESAYVMTDAGVLDLVNVKVHVDIKSSQADSELGVGVGTSEDVEAWVQGLPVFEITGLKDWQKLASKERQGEVEEKPAVAGSDLWLYEKSGKGAVSFDYEVTQPGNTSLVAYAGDGSPLTVTLSWKRPGILVSTLPYIVMGGLLVAIGIVLSLIGLREGEESLIGWFNSLLTKFQKKKKTSVKPIDISDIDISVPSRDELVAQRRDEQRNNTGGVLGAGIIPVLDEDFREDTAEVFRPGNAWASKGNGKGDDDEA